MADAYAGGGGYAQEFKAFVGDISRDADEDSTNKFLKKYGPTAYEIYNSGKGFSFVKFSTAEELAAFVEKVNGKEFLGQAVRADNGSKGKSATGEKAAQDAYAGGGGGGYAQEFKAFVGNISHEADENNTNKFLKKYVSASAK